MKISKIEVAQRQLDCAIRLLVADEDIVAIHALSRAAFRVLIDIYPTTNSDGFDRSLESLIERFGWQQFNRATNFYKHADIDPREQLSVAHRYDTLMGMGFSCILYGRINETMTPEMRAFDWWMQFIHPEMFELPSDPDPDFDRQFRESLKILSCATQREQLEFAKKLIGFFSERRDLL